MTDKAVNNSNSQNDVITTMTHVLLSFQDAVRHEMPNCAIVYDEQLSYETAIEQYLANSNYNGSDGKPMPLFAYNRTVLIDVEHGLGKRGKSQYGTLTLPNNKKAVYSTAYGEFEIQFVYFSKAVELSEKFEVVYNSDEGITGTKEIIVDMADLGEFKYFLDYQELTEKTIEREDNFYKSIIGSIKVRGFYFTFRSESSVIAEINAKIYASRNVKEKLKDELIADNIIT